MIYVTHDQTGLDVADRIGGMRGRIEQVGTPLGLYDGPTMLVGGSWLARMSRPSVQASGRPQPGASDDSPVRTRLRSDAACNGLTEHLDEGDGIALRPVWNSSKRWDLRPMCMRR